MVVVAAGLLLLVAAGVGWSVRSAPAVDPATAARTTFPDLPAPSGDATLAGLPGLAPSPGSVVQVRGPFDDRFRLTGLRFDGSTLTGTVQVTSDVSELLELEVLAGFYDDQGRLLGTAREVQHADGHSHGPNDGPSAETTAFRIAVPGGLSGRAVAAGVGVPVLVNE